MSFIKIDICKAGAFGPNVCVGDEVNACANSSSDDKEKNICIYSAAYRRACFLQRNVNNK